MTDDLAALIELARAGSDPVARELAERIDHAIAIPDRRVGAAFGIKRRRGGEPGWRVERRANRDDALRALARLLYGDLPIEQQARALTQKAERYLAHGWPHERRRDPGDNIERELLRCLGETGLEIPRPRQMRKILTRRG